MRMLVSLLAAAVLHGLAISGVALVASRDEERSPSVSKADALHFVDVEIVEARPDPIAEQPVVAVAPDEQSSSPLRPTARFASTRPPTSLVTPHAAEAEHPSRATPSDVPELAASSGPAFPLPVPIASPAPIALAPAVGARPETAPHGAALSAVPPSRSKIASAVPRYRTNPAPDYPIPSRRRGEEGTVLLNVVVNADGVPDFVSVRRSSGYPLLDRAALAAVRQWTFEPARVEGVPMSSQVVVPVRFSLPE